MITIFEPFCEDAKGRDCHGHASESRELLSREITRLRHCFIFLQFQEAFSVVLVKIS